MYLVLPGIGLVVMVFALVDIIRADQWTIRYLDKSIWIVIVILVPLIGSVLWFAFGRGYPQAQDRGSFGDPRRREVVTYPESATERELAALEREIADHEQDDRVRSLEAKLRARSGDSGSTPS